MNTYQIETELREHLYDLTGEQLSRVEEGAVNLIHPVTGQTFCEIAADHLVSGVKRNPSDLERVIRIAARFPGLAQVLLKHFPNDERLKDVADGWFAFEPRDPENYTEDLCSRRRKALDRRNAAIGYSIDWVIAQAEISATDPLFTERGDWGHLTMPERHMDEERIDALASLLTLFANPAVADPVA